MKICIFSYCKDDRIVSYYNYVHTTCENPGINDDTGKRYSAWLDGDRFEYPLCDKKYKPFDAGAEKCCDAIKECAKIPFTDEELRKRLEFSRCVPGYTGGGWLDTEFTSGGIEKWINDVKSWRCVTENGYGDCSDFYYWCEMKCVGNKLKPFSTWEKKVKNQGIMDEFAITWEELQKTLKDQENERKNKEIQKKINEFFKGYNEKTEAEKEKEFREKEEKEAWKEDTPKFCDREDFMEKKGAWEKTKTFFSEIFKSSPPVFMYCGIIEMGEYECKSKLKYEFNCGLSGDKKELTKTEMVGCVHALRFCPVSSVDEIALCCTKHDNCYSDKKGQKPCDKVFCKCLRKAAKGDVICEANVAEGFCRTVEQTGRITYKL